MNEGMEEIIKLILSMGFFSYVLSIIILLVGLFLIRRKVISSSNRSVSYDGENNGLIITGDIHKKTNGFLEVVTSIVGIISLFLMGIAIFIAYLAWQFPVTT